MMQGKVTGGARIRAVLDALPKQIEDDVEAAVLKGAHEVAAAQRLLTPVDTGALRDSIHVTPAGQSTPAYSQPGGASVVGPLAARITAGNTDVRYAHLVEYGTGGDSPTTPQPFFWPGYRLTRRRVVSRIKREIGKAIRKAAGFGGIAK